MKISRFVVVFVMVLVQYQSALSQYLPKKSVYKSIKVNSEYTGSADTTIIKFIEPFKQAIQKEMNVIIGYSINSLDAGKPEGLLNNFAADAVFKIAKQKYKYNDSNPIDFCILNYGGLRKGLPKGDITVGNVYELMPFDNKMCVISLKGDDVLDLFNFLAKKIEGHPIANCSLVVENGIAQNIIIDGNAIDTNKTYKIITSDYLSSGNDGMYFFKKAIKIEEVDCLIRDAFIDYILSFDKKPFQIVIDGRYTVK